MPITNPLCLKASIGLSLAAALLCFCTIPFHGVLLAILSLVFSLLSLSIALLIRHQIELEERTRRLDLLSRQTVSINTDMSFTGVSVEEARRSFDEINQYLRDTGHLKGLPMLVSRDCQRCQHFHGKIYGDSLLVCAMHPYGQVNCPDFEEVAIVVHDAGKMGDQSSS